MLWHNRFSQTISIAAIESQIMHNSGGVDSIAMHLLLHVLFACSACVEYESDVSAFSASTITGYIDKKKISFMCLHSVITLFLITISADTRAISITQRASAMVDSRIQMLVILVSWCLFLPRCSLYIQKCKTRSKRHRISQLATSLCNLTLDPILKSANFVIWASGRVLAVPKWAAIGRICICQSV